MKILEIKVPVLKQDKKTINNINEEVQIGELNGLKIVKVDGRYSYWTDTNRKLAVSGC